LCGAKSCSGFIGEKKTKEKVYSCYIMGAELETSPDHMEMPDIQIIIYPMKVSGIKVNFIPEIFALKYSRPSITEPWSVFGFDLMPVPDIR
jgi:hypothetical protein